MENCSITIDSLLSRLDKVRSNGHDKWMACCPAHDDSDPSLSITTGDDGRILMHCFAGCAIDEITSSLSISPRDLFQDGGNYTSATFDPSSYSSKPVSSTNQPSATPHLSRRKLVDALEHELIVQLIAIGHYKKRKIPDSRDLGRDRDSAIRINKALEVLYEI